jgi:hypothetical protein
VSLTALLLAKALYDLPRRYARRALVALATGAVAALAAQPASRASPSLGIAYLLAAAMLVCLGLVTVVSGYRETGVGASSSA